MKIEILISEPIWNSYRLPTLTNNNEWGNKVVMVKFENQEFIWMPTYKQLEDIKLALIECEKKNRDLAREHYLKQNHESLKEEKENGI